MSSSKRYTEEFKIEAIKQITERGYSVADVAKATSGSESFSLSNAATMTLTCTGAGGSASGSVTYGTWGRWRLRLQ
jgi:hypothetical protein